MMTTVRVMTSFRVLGQLESRSEISRRELGAALEYWATTRASWTSRNDMKTQLQHRLRLRPNWDPRR